VLYNCTIKVDLKEVEWKVMQWIDWAQAAVKRSALISTVINIQFSIKCGEFRE